MSRATSSSAAQRIAIANNREFDFLSDGRIRVYGLGGSLMAVYKYNKPDRELDLEAPLHQRATAHLRHQR